MKKKRRQILTGSRAYTNTDSMAFVQYQLEYGKNRRLTEKKTGKKITQVEVERFLGRRIGNSLSGNLQTETR